MKKPMFVFFMLGLLVSIQIGWGNYGANTDNKVQPDTPIDIFPFNADNGVNIISNYTDFTQQSWLNNQELINQSLNQTIEAYWNNSLVQDHFPTIAATFWWVKAMKVIDPTYLLEKTPDITTYIMNCFDSDTCIFLEQRPYDAPKQGENWVRYSSHPTITHYMAIIILAQIGTLEREIPLTQREIWDSNIRASHNSDGGFGVVFAPNSSIVETFYATFALFCLNNFSGLAISPSTRVAIANFVASTQRQSEVVTYGAGAFSEYVAPEDYPIFGWSYYLVHFFAVQILRMIQFEQWGNLEPMATQFAYFLANSHTYNTQFEYFYTEHNDYYRKTLKPYSGNTIMWDPVVYFGLNASYNEETVYATIMESWNSNGWFRNHNQTAYIECDLILQALVLEQLVFHNQTDRINSTIRTALNNTLQKFETNRGGISFTAQWYYSPAFYLPIAQKIGRTTLNQTLLDQIYQKLIPFRNDDHFMAQQWMWVYDRLIFDHADNYLRYDIKVTYEVLRTYQELGLLNRFMADMGMYYLDFEEYFVSQLLSTGVFRNSSTTSTGNLESTYYALRAQRIVIDNDWGAQFSTYYTPEQFLSIINATVPYLNSTETYWHGIAGVCWNQYQGTLYGLIVLDICNGFNATYSLERLIPFINGALSSPLSKTELMQVWEIIAYLTRYHLNIAQQIVIPTNHAFAAQIFRSEDNTDLQLAGLMLLINRKQIFYGTQFCDNMLPLDKPTRLNVTLIDHLSIRSTQYLRVNNLDFTTQSDLLASGFISVTLNPNTPGCFIVPVTFISGGINYSTTFKFTYTLTCIFSGEITETDSLWTYTITAVTPAIHSQFLSINYTKNGTLSVQVTKNTYQDSWVTQLRIPKSVENNGSININVSSPFGFEFKESFCINRAINLPASEYNQSSLDISENTPTETFTDTNLNESNSINSKNSTLDNRYATPNLFGLETTATPIIFVFGIGTCGVVVFQKRIKKIGK